MQQHECIDSCKHLNEREHAALFELRYCNDELFGLAQMIQQEENRLRELREQVEYWRWLYGQAIDKLILDARNRV